jgi:hypothetical protein
MQRASDKGMRFQNGQFNCFIVLRILKTGDFCINYNKLVIWKFTGSRKFSLRDRNKGWAIGDPY